MVGRRIFFLFYLFVISLFSQEKNVSFRDIKRADFQSVYRESWAVVIGIDDYLKAPKLKYAVKDARVIAEVLIQNFGFKSENVFQLYNQQATKEEIMKAFDRIRQLAENDDRVFVFFAGHGITVQLPDGKEKGYILPYDGSQSELITNAISTDQLNEISQLIRAKHLFFVMDACYSGLIFAKAQPINPGAVEYFKMITTRKARKALTAGGRDQTVLDTGPGGHSVFTFYFIDALKNMNADLNRDGMITTYELNEYVAQRVIAESNKTQTPEYGILEGDMGGDFVFIPSIKENVTWLTGRLIVLSNVDESDVYVDGQNVGKTKEYKFEIDLKPGRYIVELRKEKYMSTKLEVDIPAGVSKSISLNLEKEIFSVNVNVEPKDAKVYANGKFIGSGSFTTDIGRGKVLFKVEKEGYEIMERAVLIDRDGLNLDFNLEPIIAKVKIETDPSEAIIIVDGNKVGITPLSFELTYGSHEVQLMKSGYKSESFRVDVRKSEAISKKIKLEETIETKAMRVYRSRLNLKNNLTYAGVGATIVSIGIGVAFHIKSEEIYSKYQAAYEIEKIRKYKSDYSKAITQRNIAITVSAGFAVLTVYNALRKVSYEEIYREIKDKEVSLDLKFYNYAGFVPSLVLRVKM